MTPAELKALLAKTDEVAVFPAHVEAELPYPFGQRTKRNRSYCPTGLYKAKVIKDGVEWVEVRPISECGDQDYEIQRRNGVLIEFDTEDLPLDRFKIKGKKVFRIFHGKTDKTPYEHTEIITREGKQYVRMIIARKAVFSSWGEYALVQAQREKEREIQEAKSDRLISAQARLMGHVNEEGKADLAFRDLNEIRSKYGFLMARYETIRHDPTGEYLPESKHKEVGHITIPIEQAEKILDLLTDEQKAQLR